MPRYNQTPENRCMPFAEWPVQDQSAWLAALQPADFLENGGKASKYSDGGRKMVVDGYGFWLAWLALAGQLTQTVPAGQRVTRDAARAYLASMECRLAPMTVQSRIRQLGRAMGALAPAEDWAWLFKAADRLRSTAAPVRDKRSRMQEADALVDLGFDLMRRAAATDDHFALSRAVLFRDGLMLALIALRPLRRRTFAAITIGRQLLKQREGWWLDLQPEDHKTKRDDAIPFPDELVEPLNIYLQEHRPLLLRNKSQAPPQEETTALWIGKGGRQLGDCAISLQLGRHTEAFFGKSVNLHLFRDCAATSIAINDPEHIRTVQAVLGHSRLETSEKYYNQAKGIEASRRYQMHVRNTKKELQAL